MTRIVAAIPGPNRRHALLIIFFAAVVVATAGSSATVESKARLAAAQASLKEKASRPRDLDA